LEGFDSREDGHGVDDAIDPDGLDGGEMLSFNLVLDVAGVTLVDKLFS
jgi:hypothetical protein